MLRTTAPPLSITNNIIENVNDSNHAQNLNNSHGHNEEYNAESKHEVEKKINNHFRKNQPKVNVQLNQMPNNQEKKSSNTAKNSDFNESTGEDDLDSIFSDDDLHTGKKQEKSPKKSSPQNKKKISEVSEEDLYFE